MSDADNVVSLGGDLTPRERNEVLVECLEDALALARGGGLVSFSGSGVCSDGETYTIVVSPAGTNTQDIGALQRLVTRMCIHADFPNE